MSESERKGGSAFSRRDVTVEMLRTMVDEEQHNTKGRRSKNYGTL
jgi:hypothetical protein